MSIQDLSPEIKRKACEAYLGLNNEYPRAFLDVRRVFRQHKIVMKRNPWTLWLFKHAVEVEVEGDIGEERVRLPVSGQIDRTNQDGVMRWQFNPYFATGTTKVLKYEVYFFGHLVQSKDLDLTLLDGDSLNCKYELIL